MERLLARQGSAPTDHRVWCWADLWQGVLAHAAHPPSVLAPAGARVVLREAIGQTRSERALAVVGPVADTAGFQRRLSGRFAAWTAAERDPKGDPSTSGNVVADEWRIFARYRRLLAKLRAEDAEGFVVWASRSLHADDQHLPPELIQPGSLSVLDLDRASRSTWRALTLFHARAESLLVTVPLDPDPAHAEPYADAWRIRGQVLDWGFVEETFKPPKHRPAGLLDVEANLFRDDSHARPKLQHVEGLSFRGAPRGEGIGRLLAIQVHELLRREPAEEILILVRNWDDDAQTVLEALRDWGLPVSAESPQPLRTAPGVIALRSALAIPNDDWDADRIARLLRNGQLRPEGLEPRALVTTATTLRDTRVFRGQLALREALHRASNRERDDAEDAAFDFRKRQNARRQERASVAVPIFQWLEEVVARFHKSGTWMEQVDRLRRLAEDLGLDPTADPALEHLDSALDDHGFVLEALGQAQHHWTWRQFAEEVESLVHDLMIPAPAALPGTVRIATVEEATGVRARHVLLANLAEGTFPTRSAVRPDPAEAVEALDDSNDVQAQADDLDPAALPVPNAFTRELGRFLRVLGSAEVELTLLYPTTNDKGAKLLAAGFLDELRWLFDSKALEPYTTDIKQLDPALLQTEHVAPAEERIRAVARAALDDDWSELVRIARLPQHRPNLTHAAAALEVNHYRGLVSEGFGPFDGRLTDAAAIARIAREFDQVRAFSPSQLESLAFCPFQFFARFVLRLDPIEERQELDDDRTERGSRIHDILEKLHTYLRDNSSEQPLPFLDQLAGSIEGFIEQSLQEVPEPASGVARGLGRIEAELLRRTGRRYFEQFKLYASKLGLAAECEHFEARFGTGDFETDPGLILGSGPDSVRIQGFIDRIDLIPHKGSKFFRIIDYKTGSSPSGTDVQSGRALQLPLYLLAAREIVLADLQAEPMDAGYWELGKKGYKPVVTMARRKQAELEILDNWVPGEAALSQFVLRLVARLRQGDFPVHPVSSTCEQFCEYRSVCRINQARLSNKPWPEGPVMDIESDSS